MSRVAEITILARKNITKEKVMNKLSWRDSYIDPNTKERIEIEYEDFGGSIQFWYCPQQRHMVPFVIDQYKPLSKNTFGEIKDFLNKLSFEHEIVDSVDGVGIQIKLDEKILKKDFENSISEIESKLDSSKFCTYEVVLNEVY